jgi:mannose-6-phosphate isomerase
MLTATTAPLHGVHVNPDAPGRRPGRLAPMRPIPAASVRPWAGRRLGEGIGERWLAGPASVVGIAGGTQRTLDDLAAIHGADLVGSRAVALAGPRFPLLVKVIDAAAWLSLQVHPTDEIAATLYGSGSLGKTEAWLVLDAEPGGTLITGPARGLSEAGLRDVVGSGTMDRRHCEERPGRAGDAYLIPAGTIHAIGAGLFVYEIEQPSDLTFRISDWGRRATVVRPIHTREALLAVHPGSHAVPSGSGWRLDGGELRVREFRLELIDVPAERRPGGLSVEVVTAVRGRVSLTGDGWHEVLDPLETLVIPATTPVYRLEPGDGAIAAVGSIPGE